MQEAPPRTPSRRAAGVQRGIFLHTWFPLLGAVSYLLLGCGHGGWQSRRDLPTRGMLEMQKV